MRLADQVGEKISHIKCTRKRWYNDLRWADRSKPPLDAPNWTISASYHSEDEEEEEREEEEREGEEIEEEEEEAEEEAERRKEAISSGSCGRSGYERIEQ